ncbi:hypothetical protein J4772_14540 [Cohnella sp. LGH]|uniref:Hydrolase n=1 Tax=Cohnella phaseoli TaxID=456490 RepID=A0A3D9IG70_9BACL|nr:MULTISPECIES: hypothetical protein [Cohnella]QTH45521.1 hypothetical protein J4772_14540 [Cohnella sp. LGH]RED60700.1 hypothetical protein DFP98_129113 [Cohnella phaseoli]
MSKQKYYVSVQAKTILPNQGDAAYELEIEAEPEDVRQLLELFEEMESFDNASGFRNLIPGIPYHHDQENDGYDYYLREVYNKLQEVGTDETKKHISQMNLE